MTSDYFARAAAEGYNRIPLAREMLADLDTPLSTYLKLANGPYSFLLESVEGSETWGRYSILGLPARTILTVRNFTIEIQQDGELSETVHCEKPLDFIEEFRARYRVAELDDAPVFSGGLVGYFAYDTVRYAEPRLASSEELLSALDDPLNNPDIVLMLAEEVVVFDNLSGTLKIIVHCDPSQPAAYQDGVARLEELGELIRSETPPVAELDIAKRQAIDPDPGAHPSSFTQAQFSEAVERVREYILAGDCMQVVLSQRLSLPFKARPVDLYRALRLLNPSPYMYYLNLDSWHIVGSSPEILARLEDNRVTVRPIAGTRKRGRNAEEDQAMEEELMNDPKELAEHLMLIDLGRNDVGRIAKTGSVRLDEQMVVERYSHVMHIVSRVSGELNGDDSALDVLKSCLPAGTLSGAPKIRAMEIIDELEPVKRGVYGGAIGYISWHGEMDTAIAIRTAVIRDEMLYLQAGAGIVADSQAELEWKECMNKAKAIIKAVQLCC